VSARVLLVEDDESVRRSTGLMLERAGLDIEGAANGEDALVDIARETFDLVLLDVMLPGIGGFEVCRRVRRFSQVPIVFLTARADVSDVVAGLELGADDYVVKPFEGAELIARVRAVLRRNEKEPAAPTIQVGEIVVDRAGFSATKHGVGLDLSATEFRLLVELTNHAGQVLTREMLLERVWGYDYLGDSRLVDMAVKRLRDKLEDDSRNPTYITTVRGVGYRFERPPE
jgi:two-component system response regulator MtrA